MFLLIYLSTGGLFRAGTPFICFGLTVVSTRAIAMFLKTTWHGFNNDLPDTPAVFVELALSLDYALFF
jgi:hypothetical protein